MTAKKILVPVVLGLVLLLGGCGKTANASSPSATSTDTTTSSTTAAAAAPTDCPTSNTTSFAKTKVLLHSGLAFGAFHRYLYKPYPAKAFTTGSVFSKGKAIVKGGAAALFIKREIRLSIIDVKANPTLCKLLVAPLTSLTDKIDAAVAKLKHGDTSGITDSNTAVASIKSSAAGAGLAITDAANPNIGG